MTFDQLERRVRFLMIYAVCTTLFVVGLAAAGAHSSTTALAGRTATASTPVDTLHAVHIKAERLDIVEPNGKLNLVMSNARLIPGAIVRGEERLDHRKGQGIAGMIFYNADETEMGGLAFQSSTRPDGYETFGKLAFDQYNQDQVVTLAYAGTDTTSSAGLHVWDRPTSVTIEDAIEAVKVMQGTRSDSTRLARAQAVLAQTQAETAFRVFVGSEDQSAAIRLHDTKGRERIRIAVDSLDQPQIVFLDANGRVVQRLLPEQ
jgi:uncharacterized membrane protein